MKKFIMVIMCLSCTGASFSQTWDEWFNQAATQKKYLIQQIAALQVYIGYLEKGYKIAKNGLTAIGNIKDGHFSLDKDFFASLHDINPTVRNYAKVADIIAMNIRIVQAYKRTMNVVKQNGLVSKDERGYMNLVFEKLIDGCSDLTDQLTAIITPGKLQMSDDERMRRIDRIYADVQEKYVFADNFGSEAGIISVQRSNEQKDVNSVHSLYGVY